jgi:O-methyltransferase involved in polyketide biosynthesis
MTRTDQDTWDLASSVGATATWVAACRALAGKQPNALIDDPFADPLVRAVAKSPMRAAVSTPTRTPMWSSTCSGWST